MSLQSRELYVVTFDEHKQARAIQSHKKWLSSSSQRPAEKVVFGSSVVKY